MSFGVLSSDGGVLMLRKVEQRLRIADQMNYRAVADRLRVEVGKVVDERKGGGRRHLSILASLAPRANRSARSTATSKGENTIDPYDVVRTLLSFRDTHDAERAFREIRSILVCCQQTQRAEFWERLAEEAEYHGVAPLLEPTILAFARDNLETVPNDARWAFVALAGRHRRASLAREACVDDLLKAFATAGIPNILLKGTALAHLIYPAPEVRPMVDIDILIDPVDLERAVSTVCALGYSFAPRHGSRFAGRMHHLPAATITKSGFGISIEIHLDAMSPDVVESLTFATLSATPRPFQRGSGPQGLALGHTDMLRHLVRHAFEPARRVRLKHLYDLWRYQMKFADEIDWHELEQRFPEVLVTLQLVSYVFTDSRSAKHVGFAPKKVPAGVGAGMVPLSEIAKMPFKAKLDALFNPSAWWLHGYYGVPPGESLLFCRTIRHPLTLVRWFARRLTAAIVPSQTALQRVSNDVFTRHDDRSRS